jgi:hypothetical protein
MAFVVQQTESGFATEGTEAGINFPYYVTTASGGGGGPIGPNLSLSGNLTVAGTSTLASLNVPGTSTLPTLNSQNVTAVSIDGVGPGGLVVNDVASVNGVPTGMALTSVTSINGAPYPPPFSTLFGKFEGSSFATGNFPLDQTPYPRVLVGTMNFTASTAGPAFFSATVQVNNSAVIPAALTFYFFLNGAGVPGAGARSTVGASYVVGPSTFPSRLTIPLMMSATVPIGLNLLEVWCVGNSSSVPGQEPQSCQITCFHQ